MRAISREELKGYGIEKFDGTDFGYWRMQIEGYLYVKKLHLTLLGEKPESCTQCDQGEDHNRVDGDAV